MSWTTFWLVLGPILATLVSIVGTVFVKEWWVGKFWNPRLFILDENVLPQPTSDTIWHRIIVDNSGRSAAENCVGSITLDATADDIWEKPLSYTINIYESQPILTKRTFCKEEMVLCWSRLGNPESRTINRESTAALEVFRVIRGSDDLRLEIPTENGWNPNIRIALKANKEYSGKIKITSANTDPALAEVKLVPQADGDVRLNILKREPRKERNKEEG